MKYIPFLLSIIVAGWFVASQAMELCTSNKEIFLEQEEEIRLYKIPLHITNGSYFFCKEDHDTFNKMYWDDYRDTLGSYGYDGTVWHCGACKGRYPITTRILRPLPQVNKLVCPFPEELCNTKALLVMLLYLVLDKDLHQTYAQRPRVNPDTELEKIAASLRRIDTALRGEITDEKTVTDIIAKSLMNIHIMTSYATMFETQTIKFIADNITTHNHNSLRIVLAEDEEKIINSLVRSYKITTTEEPLKINYDNPRCNTPKKLLNVLVTGTSKRLLSLYNHFERWDSFPEMVIQKHLSFKPSCKQCPISLERNICKENLDHFMNIKNNETGIGMEIVTCLRSMHIIMNCYNKLHEHDRYFCLKNIYEFFKGEFINFYHLKCADDTN